MTDKTNDLPSTRRPGDRMCLSFVVLSVAVVLLPVILMGIPDGKDLSHHLKFSQIYYEALALGDFFPGWAASDNFGFGQAGIRFYPPLAYYALGGTRILTGNWFDAVWINFFFWMLAGSIGVYYWAKELLSPRWAAAVAILYAIAPYHLSQIYQTWLYAEFVAAGVLPFCFLFAARVCRFGKWSDVLLLSLSLSFLTLSHIPTTIIGGLSLAVYVLSLIERREFKETFAKLCAAAFLSLGMSAFHWTKIVTEVEWVLFNTAQYSTGYYDYRNHIFPLFAATGEYYQARLLWFFDALFVLSALFFVPGVVYLFTKPKSEKDSFSRKSFVSVTITGIFSLFMASAASEFLWRNLALLQKLQFPWRWLSVASLAGAMAYVLACSRLMQGAKNLKKAGIYLGLTVLVAASLFNLTQNILPAAPISRADFDSQTAVLIAEAGCPCWFPVWAKSQAFQRGEKVSAGERRVQINVWEAESREFKIEPGSPTVARAATFYYPHWKAEINGRETEVGKDENGAIAFPVSGEGTVVKLQFREPFAVKIASWISLFAWAFFTAALVYLKGRKSFANPSAA